MVESIDLGSIKLSFAGSRSLRGTIPGLQRPVRRASTITTGKTVVTTIDRMKERVVGGLTISGAVVEKKVATHVTMRIDIETAKGNHFGPTTTRPPQNTYALPERDLFFKYSDISDQDEKKREKRGIDGSGRID